MKIVTVLLHQMLGEEPSSLTVNRKIEAQMWLLIFRHSIRALWDLLKPSSVR
jgi:hypothetical protein